MIRTLLTVRHARAGALALPQFDTNTEQQPLLKNNPAETGFLSREEASSTRGI
jgi:hypothetical protein